MKEYRDAILIVIVGVALIVGLKVFVPKQPETQKEDRNGWAIREIRRCEDAGLKAQVIQSDLTLDTVKINCVPKEDTK